MQHDMADQERDAIESLVELRQVRQRLADLRSMRGYMVEQGADPVIVEEIDNWLAEIEQDEHALRARCAAERG